MQPRLIWLLSFLLACAISSQAQESDAFSRKIHLPSSRSTVYGMLDRLTEQSGFCFIYDSDLLNNEKKVVIPEGTYSLREAILLSTGDKTIRMKLIGQHILLYKEKNASPKVPASSFLTIEGTVRDKNTNEALPFSTIEIYKTGIGTVANQNGNFMLKLPDSLLHSSVYISHLGYEPQLINAGTLSGKHNEIGLNTRAIPMKEVIVRLINPVKILKDMIEKRPENYAGEPVFLTSFYREGIEKRKGLFSLTEAVFKVYKTEYNSMEEDQVKLLKMRQIVREEARDSLILKMKSGVESSLILDIMKELPDFLSFDAPNSYNYSKIDMCVIDSHLAHVIAFEQKEGIREALFKGELYVDAENSALLSARIEINPVYISKTGNIFVCKKSKFLKITPQKVVYTVSYKPHNGKYYINHVRGDLNFRIKKKNQLFHSSVHTWFEMVTCQIDTLQVKPFPHRQSLPVHKVFSETDFKYDKDFWEDFNIILPEKKLNEAISRFNSRITETE